MSRILITGGSGFLGGHCIVSALAAGHEVRASVRSAEKADSVRAMLAAAGVNAGQQLTFASADLTSDDGWAEAVAGCDHVLHTASPFPAVQPEDPDELIAPARDGTLRVLRAASAAGVKRVVLTSSFAAVGYGHKPADYIFTEEDWTPLEEPNQPYIKSKVIAERAAWDFVGANGALELSVINPTGIFGPVFGSELSTSIQMIKGLLEGAFPKELPEMWFGVVDVRDVADLHLRAMIDPAAAGERFVAVSGEPLSLLGVATILRENFGDLAARVPTRSAAPAPENSHRRSSNEKARQLLGWFPQTSEAAIIASAESLKEKGLLKPFD